MALRTTRTYKTGLYKAVTLIASMPPILLLEKERVFSHKKGVKTKENLKARQTLPVNW